MKLVSGVPLTWLMDALTSIPRRILFCHHFISTLRLLLNLAGESPGYSGWLLHTLPCEVLACWLGCSVNFFFKWVLEAGY